MANVIRRIEFKDPDYVTWDMENILTALLLSKPSSNTSEAKYHHENMVRYFILYEALRNIRTIDGYMGKLLVENEIRKTSNSTLFFWLTGKPAEFL